MLENKQWKKYLSFLDVYNFFNETRIWQLTSRNKTVVQFNSKEKGILILCYCKIDFEAM